MKHNLLLNHLFLICALLWYVIAALKYFSGSSGTTTWICLGSLYLCLYSIQVNKHMKEKADQERMNDKEAV